MVKKIALHMLILTFGGCIALVAPANAQTGMEAAADGSGYSEFNEFNVSLSDSLVRAQTKATVTFSLSGLDSWDIIDGRLRFTFPDGFQLDGVRLERFSGRIGDLSFFDDGFSVSGQTVTIQVEAEFDDGSPPERKSDLRRAAGSPLPLLMIEFTARFDNLRNPATAGQYSLVGLALDEDGRTTAGPDLSELFSVIGTPSGIARIEISPDTALELRAGQIQTFGARAFDAAGVEIPDIDFIFSISDIDGDDDIGDLTGATLLATTVGMGRVVVRTANPALFFEDYSEPITVLPGDLDDVQLRLDPDQVIGALLRGDGEDVIFFDRYNNRKIDLNLESAPLTLDAGSGTITPNVIIDNSLLVGGAIDLSATGSTYSGPTAQTTIRAASGGVSSDDETVWFHGYDVIAINDIAGNPIQQVVEGSATELQILVQNNGRTAPSAPVQLSVGFGAQRSDSLVTTFVGRANGLVDTISIILPAYTGEINSTAISARLDWQFKFDDETHEGWSDRVAPVSIVPAIAATPVPGSFVPDTAVIGYPFEFGLKFLAPTFTGPIDNATLAVTFARLDDPSASVVVFDDTAPVASFENDTITHADLPIDESAMADLTPGNYSITVDYTFESGGTVITIPATVMDNISLLAGPEITYITASFSPTTVFADRASSFTFDVLLESDYPITLAQPAGAFIVSGDNFGAGVSLFGAGPQLTPGENLLTTELVYIPGGQAGNILTATATVQGILPGLDNPVALPIDLSSVDIGVVELPLIRIVSLDVVAPNSPRVNTGQQFTLTCAVENLAGAPVGPVTLELASNGASSFDTTMTVDVIPARDTAMVDFTVIAADMPDQAEVFQIFIDPGVATEAAPIDNIALVTIEEPAELTLEYDLIGDASGLVGRGEEFTLSVLLRNIGQAAVGLGRYEIFTDNIDFGLEEFSGVITVGQNLAIPLVAPDVDTAATIEFSITDIPLDANSRQEAILRDTSFSFTLQVQSIDGDVLVDVIAVGSPLVVPGRQQELLEIILTNRGRAEVTVAELQEITITASVSGADADQLLVADATQVLEGETPIAEATIGRDRITLAFGDGWQLAAEETRRLRFVTQLQPSASGQFALRIERDDFRLRFIQGPLAGLPVDIASPDGNNIVFDQQFRVRGATIDESFVIEDNPFNPREAPARFAYELPQASGIEFRVFTLTGELVYSKDLPIGAPGTEPNQEQFIEWAGANGPGDIVMNGVYIVSLRVTATGETVQRKVVVLK